jgi:hypothetical protein
MNLISEDYLMHYGVKGMKWGVRNDPRVVDAANKRKKVGAERVKAENALTKYTFRHPLASSFTSKNYNTWKKLDNNLQKANNDYNKASKNYYDTKTLAKNEKKTEKLEKYQSKLIKKADKNAGNYRKSARETKNEIDDIKRMGSKSAYWQQHAREEANHHAQVQASKLRNQGYSNKDAEFWGKMHGGSKYMSMMSSWSNKEQINSYVKDLSDSRSNSIRLAKQYANNKKSLMNYKINYNTKKKDIRKTYRENLRFYE